jgi:integrase
LGHSWVKETQRRPREADVGRENVRHRGHAVVPHGHRWRFRWNSTWVTRNTLAGAVEELDRLIEERERNRYIGDVDACTVADLVREWWHRKQPELRESSRLRYEGVIRVHIDPKLGAFSAEALRPLDVQDFYAKVTYKTALVSRDVLRPAFRWGMTNGLVRRTDGTNPFDLARLSRSACLGGDAETDANRTMAVDERLIPSSAAIEKLLTDAEEREDWAWWLYLRLAPSLGTRPGELCALQRCDLDEATHTVSITKAANGATFKITTPKRSASVRELYVGGELFEDILPLLSQLQPDEYLFPAVGKNKGERLMPCWNAHGVRSRLTRAAKRLDMQRYTPHSFRHYCATMLLDQGWPPMQVARWLGHRNDTMVRLLYAAHVVEDTRLLLGEAAGRLIRREAPDRKS